MVTQDLTTLSCLCIPQCLNFRQTHGYENVRWQTYVNTTTDVPHVGNDKLCQVFIKEFNTNSAWPQLAALTRQYKSSKQFIHCITSSYLRSWSFLHLSPPPSIIMPSHILICWSGHEFMHPRGPLGTCIISSSHSGLVIYGCLSDAVLCIPHQSIGKGWPIHGWDLPFEWSISQDLLIPFHHDCFPLPWLNHIDVGPCSEAVRLTTPSPSWNHLEPQCSRVQYSTCNWSQTGQVEQKWPKNLGRLFTEALLVGEASWQGMETHWEGCCCWHSWPVFLVE